MLRLLMVVMVGMLLTACQLRLISAYDPALVQQLNTIQTGLNHILLNVEQSAAVSDAHYSNFSQQYIQLIAQLTTLISQQRAIPYNHLTIQQLVILQDSVLRLQKLHQQGFKQRKTVRIIRSSLNSQFTSLYELQYGKQQERR